MQKYLLNLLPHYQKYKDMSHLKQYLKSNNECIVMMGTLNFDLLQSNTLRKSYLLEQLRTQFLLELFSPLKSTHDEGKMFDVCLTNASLIDLKLPMEASVYESFYSHLKPIFVTLNLDTNALPNSDSINDKEFYAKIDFILPHVKLQSRKCNTTLCGSCSSIIQVEKSKRKRVANCQDTCGIYLIVCAQCLTKYVGQTDRTFRERIGEHLRDITDVNSTSIGNHFNNKKCFRCHFRWVILDAGIIDGKERRQIESFYIDKLSTVAPNGLNTKN